MLSDRQRLGVLGWPIGHSRSPQIHNAALAKAGLEGWRYQLLPVPPPLLASTVRALGAAGFRGANVTIPHKQAAALLADRLSPAASEIGAVNTLLFKGDEIEADNTDAPALIAALPLSARGRTALVLGAGGSAQAAVWALFGSGATQVRVWNRTPHRAREIADRLGATPVTAPVPADILVNCTPAGMAHEQPPLPGDLKPLPIAADEVSMFASVVDFVYTEGETPLVSAARRAGLPVVDGWELLVGQAALSFEQFTGIRAPVEAMRAAARYR